LEGRVFVIQAALLIDKLHKFLGLSTRAWINVLQIGVYATSPLDRNQPIAEPSLTI
jgi:hypothetical protein